MKLQIITLVLVANIVIGIFVFHYGMSLTYLDAVYFVATIITTIGFGDFNLLNAPIGVKIYGIYLMFSGASGYALFFSLITDYLIKSRILELTGRRRYRMKNHVILCGFGRLGPKILEHLLMLGDSVLIIEMSENENIDALRMRKIPYIIGNITKPEVLQKASIMKCKSIIFGTDKDLTNLEGALTARELRPDVRVILRIYDEILAQKIEKGFNIPVVLSTSTLAAPTFAQAAHDQNIIDAIKIEDDLFLTTTITINSHSRLNGITLRDLRRKVDFAALSLCQQGNGERIMFPQLDQILQEGDELTFTTNRKSYNRIKHFNENNSGLQS